MVAGLIGSYKYSQYAFRDSSGYAIGQESDPDNASAGTTTHAYLYDKPISLAGIALTYGIREGRGGAKIWTRKVVGVEGVDNAALELSAYDTVLDGYFKGITPDVTTNSSHTIMARNSNLTTPAAFVSLHSYEFDIDDGSSKWINHVILNQQIVEPPGRSTGQESGTNPNPLSYEIVPNDSSRNVFGQLWSAANLTVADDSDKEMFIISDKPLGMTTYIDDGVATEFITGYRPTSAVVGDHFFFTNGVVSTPSAINATTGAVTITAATSGDIWLALYQTSFVSI